MESASHAWRRLVSDIKHMGQEQTVRGMKTVEVLGHQSAIDMSKPVVQNLQRKLGLKFMAAEAHWILTGQNKVESIAPYSKEISNFSDDGVFYHGAYGPKIIDQLPYVVRALHKDPNTRQAVINIWRETPPETKDVPCTLSVQWLVRDNKLHCIDTMRSSDIWLGWPYDVFNFSMLSLYLLLLLRNRPILNIDWQQVTLGNLVLNAGSQHYYEKHFDKVHEAVQSPLKIIGEIAYVQNPNPNILPNDLLDELAFLKDYPYSSGSEPVILGEVHEVFKARYGV